jgi:twitching motility protein PilT
MLKGVVSQRLVPTKDGGRVASVEVMVSTARIRELIADETRFREIKEAIEDGKDTYGMQSFDQSLMHLLNEGLITYEEALAQTSNPDDFALKLSGIDGGAGGGGGWEPTYQGDGAKEENVFDFDDF